MKKSKMIDILFGLAIVFLLTFPTAVFLIITLGQPNASNVSLNQEENSEYLKITWIADWSYPGTGHNNRYENFVAYLWWPDNAEFVGIRWIAFYYRASAIHKNIIWKWRINDDWGENISYWIMDTQNLSSISGTAQSLPDWLLLHVPEFGLVEMNTPTGRRTVARVRQREYWENIQYNINVWIKIPRRVAENREFTGIELGENTDLLGRRYWSDKAYFYFDYEPKKPMDQVFHLNLEGCVDGVWKEGAYMNTLLTATVIPGKWIKSGGYGIGSYEVLDSSS